MPSELADHIATISVIDTHSHMDTDLGWDLPPDILCELFDWYIVADLAIAGASSDAITQLRDRTNRDLEGRFAGISAAWDRCQFTGYGEALRIAARDLYQIEEFTGPAIREGQLRLEALHRDTSSIELLRDRARIDHIQTDLGMDAIEGHRDSATYFLRDLSWRRFVVGEIDDGVIEAMTGVEIGDLASLTTAMETMFAYYAPSSIAVKTQHAYSRTLAWQERSDADAERALQGILTKQSGSEDPQSAERLCLGDWCFGRGVALAAEHRLPIKIHTGYLASTGGNGTAMQIDRLRAGHLAPLLMEFPQAQFVLMHIAYPYSEELIALSKHFENVYVDLCWAWSVNPLASKEFVRRFLHAVPLHKLFAFGDDTMTTSMVYGYSMQMRRWLGRALEEEIAEGHMTTRQAVDVASRLLRENQLVCFDIEGRQRTIAAAADSSTPRAWPYRYLDEPSNESAPA